MMKSSVHLYNTNKLPVIVRGSRSLTKLDMIEKGSVTTPVNFYGSAREFVDSFGTPSLTHTHTHTDTQTRYNLFNII